MTSLRQRLAADLAAAGCAPLHRLGQNFMIDPSALDCLVTELGAAAGVRVVEIGPGTGHLTERLVAAGCTVLAVELDKGLFAHLQGLASGVWRLASDGVTPDARHQTPDAQRQTPDVELVHGDCLASKNELHPAITAFAAAGPWRLGANLPYDVALPVLLNAAALPRPPERVVVTVQYEAAQRLCSRPGQDAWGASAAVLQAAGTPRLVRRLGPSCFHPQPRVDSAILAWEPAAALPAGFGRWCRAVFSARRKVLPGALRDAGHERAVGEAACRACGLDIARRLEDLAASELVALFRALHDGTAGHAKE